MQPLLEPVYCSYCGSPAYPPATKCDGCGAPLNFGQNQQKLALELLPKIMDDGQVGFVESINPGCITVDDIDSLRYQLPTEYRSGRCCYIIHPDPLAILSALRKNNGRYLIDRAVFSDAAGNPTSLYLIDDYRLCFVPHSGLSTFRKPAECEPGRAAMVFGNLEEYQKGNKDAVWKLVFA